METPLFIYFSLLFSFGFLKSFFMLLDDFVLLHSLMGGCGCLLSRNWVYRIHRRLWVRCVAFYRIHKVVLHYTWGFWACIFTLYLCKCGSLLCWIWCTAKCLMKCCNGKWLSVVEGGGINSPNTWIIFLRFFFFFFFFMDYSQIWPHP